MYKNTAIEQTQELPAIVQLRTGETTQQLRCEALALGQLGVKRVVFDSPELASEWMARIARRPILQPMPN